MNNEEKDQMSSDIRPIASPITGAAWQPIATAPKDEEVWFWIVPKTPDEAYVNTTGDPIFGVFEPFLLKGKFKTWSALSKATHWMPLPAPPLTAPTEGSPDD